MAKKWNNDKTSRDIAKRIVKKKFHGKEKTVRENVRSSIGAKKPYTRPEKEAKQAAFMDAIADNKNKQKRGESIQEGGLSGFMKKLIGSKKKKK